MPVDVPIWIGAAASVVAAVAAVIAALRSGRAAGRATSASAAAESLRDEVTEVRSSVETHRIETRAHAVGVLTEQHLHDQLEVAAGAVVEALTPVVKPRAARKAPAAPKTAKTETAAKAPAEKTMVTPAAAVTAAVPTPATPAVPVSAPPDGAGSKPATTRTRPRK